jgi:hypothetical protein
LYNSRFGPLCAALISLLITFCSCLAIKRVVSVAPAQHTGVRQQRYIPVQTLSEGEAYTEGKEALQN